MKAGIEEIIRIHISHIDEFIAGRFLEKEGSPLAFGVRSADGVGAIELRPIMHKQESSAAEGIDFDLSSCECGGLGQDDPSIYIDRPVFTSSAYEFFDYLLEYYSAFDCYIEFTGNAWRVRVENAADNVR